MTLPSVANVSSSRATFSEHHRDMLGELVNIAHGQATTLLGNLVGSALNLQAPTLSVCSQSEAVRRLVPEEELLSNHYMIAQSFRPLLCGEGILFLCVDDPANFRAHLKLEDNEPDAGGALEVGNLVIGGCVGQLAELLGTHIAYSPLRIAERLPPPRNNSEQVLLAQTSFHLLNNEFAGHFNLVIPSWAWPALCENLDMIMERMFGDAS